MKTGSCICEPPDDGREWILGDDAAALLGVTRFHTLRLARRFNWTRYQRPAMQTWILKSDVVRWNNFLKDRQRWYKRRRPKNWIPETAMCNPEDEALFQRIYWSTTQAAEFMGVTIFTIHRWTRQGRIPVFLTRKMGKGGKYWYSPTSLRNLKESEEWQKRRTIWEKGKATLRQGIGAREAYTARHRPYIYQGIPPGWITMREVAERLEINIGTAHYLRKMNRFMSEQFVGEWDTKKRPWFCDEDGVERLKNDEEYQKLRRRERDARQARLGKPPLDAASPTKESYQPVPLASQHDTTFCYTNEELKLPRERVIGVDDMW